MEHLRPASTLERLSSAEWEEILADVIRAATESSEPGGGAPDGGGGGGPDDDDLGDYDRTQRVEMVSNGRDYKGGLS